MEEPGRDCGAGALVGRAHARPRALRGRPPWVGPALAVGIVLLLGLVVGWAAGVFKVKTEKGDLVFSGLPEHAVVSVDGKVYTVEWPGGKGPAKVTVPVGEHRVKVELNGVEVYGEEVKIATGEKTPIRVRLERHVATPQPPPHQLNPLHRAPAAATRSSPTRSG